MSPVVFLCLSDLSEQLWAAGEAMLLVTPGTLGGVI